MFKRFIILLLVAALAVSSFQQLLVDAGFVLNRKYIAENLCINKSRPWMHCNGKCYLMRKIKEAQQREANSQRRLQKSMTHEINVLNSTPMSFHTLLLRLINTPYPSGIPVNRKTTLFRPPRFISSAYLVFACVWQDHNGSILIMT